MCDDCNARLAMLIRAGDRVAATCEALARKLDDCTTPELAEAVNAWTDWHRIKREAVALREPRQFTALADVVAKVLKRDTLAGHRQDLHDALEAWRKRPGTQESEDE